MSKNTDVFAPRPHWDAPTLALWSAIRDRSGAESIQAALAQGPDLTVANRYGISPLVLAIHHDFINHSAALALLAAGAPLMEAKGQSLALEAAKKLLDGGDTLRFLTRWREEQEANPSPSSRAGAPKR